MPGIWTDAEGAKTKIHGEGAGRLLRSLRLKSATQVWHSEQCHGIQFAHLDTVEKYGIICSKSSCALISVSEPWYQFLLET